MPDGFNMVFGLNDFGQLWPADIRTACGQLFTGSEVWRAVGERFDTMEGQRLLNKIRASNRQYVATILQGSPAWSNMLAVQDVVQMRLAASPLIGLAMWMLFVAARGASGCLKRQRRLPTAERRE